MEAPLPDSPHIDARGGRVTQAHAWSTGRSMAGGAGRGAQHRPWGPAMTGFGGGWNQGVQALGWMEGPQEAPTHCRGRWSAEGPRWGGPRWAIQAASPTHPGHQQGPRGQSSNNCALFISYLYPIYILISSAPYPQAAAQSLPRDPPRSAYISNKSSLHSYLISTLSFRKPCAPVQTLRWASLLGTWGWPGLSCPRTWGFLCVCEPWSPHLPWHNPHWPLPLGWAHSPSTGFSLALPTLWAVLQTTQNTRWTHGALLWGT